MVQLGVMMPSMIDTVTTGKQGGSIRIVLKPEWVKATGVKTRMTLPCIISGAMIVLPPVPMTDEELNDMIEDIRTLHRIAYKNIPPQGAKRPALDEGRI